MATDDDEEEVQHVCNEKLEEEGAIWDGQCLWCFLLGARFSWWSFLCARFSSRYCFAWSVQSGVAHFSFFCAITKEFKHMSHCSEQTI